MRVARDFAVVGIRGTPAHHAPERPRVADPGRRRRIADYLSGGTAIGRGHGPDVLHTDGVWVWPERFVVEILDAGLAPEPDFLGEMDRSDFRAPAPASDDRLTAAALTAWRAGPPAGPHLSITYFVRLDGDSTPDAPLSLLRRVAEQDGPTGRVTAEALWRDLDWHPTRTFDMRKVDNDIREVTPAHAAGVLDTWCARWHREALSRSRASP